MQNFYLPALFSVHLKNWLHLQPCMAELTAQIVILTERERGDLMSKFVLNGTITTRGASYALSQ